MQAGQVGLHGGMSNGGAYQQRAQWVSDEADFLRQFIQGCQVVQDFADKRLGQVLHVAVGGVSIDAVAHEKVQRVHRQCSFQVSPHLENLI